MAPMRQLPNGQLSAQSAASSKASDVRPQVRLAQRTLDHAAASAADRAELRTLMDRDQAGQGGATPLIRNWGAWCMLTAWACSTGTSWRTLALVRSAVRLSRSGKAPTGPVVCLSGARAAVGRWTIGSTTRSRLHQKTEQRTFSLPISSSMASAPRATRHGSRAHVVTESGLALASSPHPHRHRSSRQRLNGGHGADRAAPS